MVSFPSRSDRSTSLNVEDSERSKGWKAQRAELAPDLSSWSWNSMVCFSCWGLGEPFHALWRPENRTGKALPDRGHLINPAVASDKGIKCFSLLRIRYLLHRQDSSTAFLFPWECFQKRLREESQGHFIGGFSSTLQDLLDRIHALILQGLLYNF